jgi:hypothetical protein
VNQEEEEEEEEEEGLFKANAVNEEDPERDRATQVQETRPARRTPSATALGGNLMHMYICATVCWGQNGPRG